MHAGRTIGIFLSCLALAACAFDHRRQVAYELLYQEDGFESDAAFLAALNARFPRGSSLNEIERLAARMKGECHSSPPNRLICEIATRGQICAARLIRFDVDVQDGKVREIRFLSGGLGC